MQTMSSITDFVRLLFTSYNFPVILDKISLARIRTSEKPCSNSRKEE
jgi:hypothetical protein